MSLGNLDTISKQDLTILSYQLYNLVNVNVKESLYDARKNTGLTQDELAQSIQISRQAYVSIESGKSVPLTEIALRIGVQLFTASKTLKMKH